MNILAVNFFFLILLEFMRKLKCLKIPVGDQPRGILSWIANTPRSSYYMMNIDGHNLYRLNYPLRLNKWYHSCQSWNGRTGEWQIWVNDERVGRGFNNRVRKLIKSKVLTIKKRKKKRRELAYFYVCCNGGIF